MSEWAFRKCEKCGSRVHINSTCKSWSNRKCDGDPWGEKNKLLEDINIIKERIETHKSTLKALRENRDRLTKKLKSI